MNKTIHKLVASTSTQGQFALDEDDGPTLSGGQPLAIKINNQWIEGHVEYAPQLYPNMGPQRLGEPPREPAVIGGYYFHADTGGVCGLCVDMLVRLR